MRRSRKWTGLSGWASIAAVAVLVTACSSGGGSKDADNGAVPSGEITVYSGQGASTIGALVKGFEAKAGVTVHLQEVGESELADRLVKEGRKSPADVVVAEGSSPLGMLAINGLLALADVTTSAKVDASWNSTDGTWVAMSAVACVGVGNPDKISPAELPASLLDLGGASWSGKLGIVPTSEAFQAQITVLRKTHGAEMTKAWLEAVKGNAQVYPSNGDLLDAVDRGDIAFGLVNHSDWFTKRAELGDKLHAELHYFAGGDAGAFVDVSAAAVLKSSKNPRAAQAFLAYLVGAEAQQIIGTRIVRLPARRRCGLGCGTQAARRDQVAVDRQVQAQRRRQDPRTAAAGGADLTSACRGAPYRLTRPVEPPLEHVQHRPVADLRIDRVRRRVGQVGVERAAVGAGVDCSLTHRGDERACIAVTA